MSKSIIFERIKYIMEEKSYKAPSNREELNKIYSIYRKSKINNNYSNYNNTNIYNNTHIINTVTPPQNTFDSLYSSDDGCGGEINARDLGIIP